MTYGYLIPRNTSGKRSPSRLTNHRLRKTLHLELAHDLKLTDAIDLEADFLSFRHLKVFYYMVCFPWISYSTWNLKP